MDKEGYLKIKERIKWANNKADRSKKDALGFKEVYLVLQHKQDKDEVVGIKRYDYTKHLERYKDWRVVYSTEVREYAEAYKDNNKKPIIINLK
tara:strand:- start:291 stop:569 length:279 start_codon:yes stop_codon:yes gene_type:complete